MTRGRPLRFLALILCGWVGARAIVLTMAAPPPAQAIASAPEAMPPASIEPAAPRPRPTVQLLTTIVTERPLRGEASDKARLGVPILPAPRAGASAARAAWIAAPVRSEPGEAQTDAMAGPAPLGFPMLDAAPPARPARLSGSAWLLLRDDRGAASLAPGGTLGGSQAGTRLTYRVGTGLALSARAYTPLRRIRGAEVAVGIDWRPSTRLPLHLLAERRQDVGGEGRSAFALTVYGGASGRLPGGLRAEGYGQAGIVGTRSHDLFVDGSARIALPVGPVEIGGGAWGAAQPGVARLDAGPSVSYHLPVGRHTLRLQADWRVRIAGDAAPGSGPAFTVAADF